MSTIIDDAPSSLLQHLRKVYALLTTALLVTAGTAYAAVAFGSLAPVQVGKYTLEATPAVRFGIEHPVICSIIFLVFGLAAVAVRSKRSFGLGALFSFAAVSGVFIGPVVAMASFLGHHGLSFSANPVRDAAILTVGAFVGLSSYTVISRRDFNFLGGFLFTGLVVLILAGFLNIFLGSAVLDMALASVGVLVFTGYILFDTSNMVRDHSDPAGDALSLYLDVLNLFLSLLRLFMSGLKKD